MLLPRKAHPLEEETMNGPPYNYPAETVRFLWAIIHGFFNWFYVR